MKINFESLRNIIRDRHNKNKNTSDSAVCLNEFLNLEVNSVEEIRKMRQDESANFIMSLQNWFLRRNFTSTKICISIGDIFYADLGINYKPEFSYHHPVVILEKIGGMYLVVPVSTTPDNIKNAFHPIDNPDGNKMMRKVYGNDMGDKSDGFEKIFQPGNTFQSNRFLIIRFGNIPYANGILCYLIYIVLSHPGHPGRKTTESPAPCVTL